MRGREGRKGSLSYGGASLEVLAYLHRVLVEGPLDLLVEGGIAVVDVVYVGGLDAHAPSTVLRAGLLFVRNVLAQSAVARLSDA